MYFVIIFFVFNAETCAAPLLFNIYFIWFSSSFSVFSCFCSFHIFHFYFWYFLWLFSLLLILVLFNECATLIIFVSLRFSGVRLLCGIPLQHAGPHSLGLLAKLYSNLIKITKLGN